MSVMDFAENSNQFAGRQSPVLLVSVMINLQPTLSGKLVQLRPLRDDEFEALFEAASDRLIWEQHPSPLRYQREVFQKFFDEALACKGALAVIDAETGQVIGSSRYYAHNLERSEIVIGYTFLARRYWGGKFNRELKTLMLGHIFQFVDDVLFHVGSKNVRSQKAMEKMGAELIESAGETWIYRIKKNASGAHKHG